jgi:HSP20 family protein
MPEAVARWAPFRELDELQTRLGRMFDQVSGGERAWTPAIDVVRDDGDLVVRAELPGIKPEEVKVEVEDDVLTVSGEHEESKEDEGKKYLRRERRYGAFSRSIALPAGVDAKKIKANTRDGIVEVKIPLPRQASKEKVEITPTAG